MALRPIGRDVAQKLVDLTARIARIGGSLPAADAVDGQMRPADRGKWERLLKYAHSLYPSLWLRWSCMCDLAALPQAEGGADATVAVGRALARCC